VSRLRKTLTVLLTVFAVFTLGYLAGQEVERGRVAAAIDPDQALPQRPRQLVATYFHETKRCVKCNTIEAYARDAVLAGYPELVSNQRVVWRVLNMDAPENRDLARRYELTGASVVLSDRVEGKEEDYAVLPRVWDLTDDKDGFLAYVRSEAEFYLEEDELGSEE
jgi:hypothetical protein